MVPTVCLRIRVLAGAMGSHWVCRRDWSFNLSLAYGCRFFLSGSLLLVTDSECGEPEAQ